MTFARKIMSIESELAICNQKMYFMGVDGFVDPPKQHFRAAGLFNNNKVSEYVATDKSKYKRGDMNNPRMYWPTYVFDPTHNPKPIWADNEDTSGIKFHEMDGIIDRKSHHGKYQLLPYIYRNGRFESGCFPVNPVDKTGITGRGQLGKWGPNHAADPIVTYVKNDKLFFVSIQRSDTGEWALPGGMVEPGDNISITIRKEFGEEAMNSMEMSDDAKRDLQIQLNKVFENATEVYRGYVDDPRNTDNSWMETVAMHVHIDESIAENFKLKAGDDAKKVEWKEFTTDIKMYADHIKLIECAIQRLVKDKTQKLPEWIRVKYGNQILEIEQIRLLRSVARTWTDKNAYGKDVDLIKWSKAVNVQGPELKSNIRSASSINGILEEELAILKEWVNSDYAK